jgi:hypothetical protein
MKTITLIIIPGAGARSINIDDDTTVAQLVCANNLHGRDIIINGTGIPVASYETTPIPLNAEVFATGSVKGNVNFTTRLL